MTLILRWAFGCWLSETLKALKTLSLCRDSAANDSKTNIINRKTKRISFNLSLYPILTSVTVSVFLWGTDIIDFYFSCCAANHERCRLRAEWVCVFHRPAQKTTVSPTVHSEECESISWSCPIFYVNTCFLFLFLFFFNPKWNWSLKTLVTFNFTASTDELAVTSSTLPKWLIWNEPKKKKKTSKNSVK